MTANNLLLLGFLFLFAFPATGQERMLHGKITNETDVEGIHILNRSSRYNSVTDALGNFSITVREQDSLFISSVNFVPKTIIVTKELYEKGVLVVFLDPLVNELKEVVFGPNLSGNLQTDIKNIKTEKPLNFDDVGIPGFKGKGEEKIVPIVPYLGLASAVDLEAMYKHISGYYRKLKLKRKWDRENVTVHNVIAFYTATFFEEAYNIPEGKLEDFLLFCIETSDLQIDFENEQYALVLETFNNRSAIYNSRSFEKKE
ncbi:hypothetical protein [Altibacter sp.]|uniref:hypothetical protein n=1 Tax=Altibacter sp. TaxID=2024823 RepID=UPI00258C76FD|nr:hypothetical protein [Altibacter sp.]MCW8980637.1 hypothetical protein [Altibacter sp.]MCW9038774.1 hypothetical protein [Altibacter sp.]